MAAPVFTYTAGDPGMDRKAALAKWKKEKPMLLLDTGVSDVLRELPDSFSTDDVDGAAVTKDAPKLNKVIKALDDKLADKKIGADKAAKKSILAIQQAIRDCMDAAKRQLAHRSTRRKDVIEIVEKAHARAGAYLKAVDGKKINPKIHGEFDFSLLADDKKLNEITLHGRSGDIMPSDLQAEYGLIIKTMRQDNDWLLDVMRDARQPAPKRKTDAEYAAAMKAFASNVAKMPKVAGALKALG